MTGHYLEGRKKFSIARDAQDREPRTAMDHAVHSTQSRKFSILAQTRGPRMGDPWRDLGPSGWRTRQYGASPCPLHGPRSHHSMDTDFLKIRPLEPHSRGSQPFWSDRHTTTSATWVSPRPLGWEAVAKMAGHYLEYRKKFSIARPKNSKFFILAQTRGGHGPGSRREPPYCLAAGSRSR